jgi:cyclopropane fatty-acyl-phospholipid synthase-like methyltransferase
MFIETLLTHLRIQPGRTLLDLGCGKGALVAALRARGYGAYGCDIAGSQASDYDAQADHSDYLKTIALDPYRLPFEDARFDVVVSDQVLEHVMDYRSVFQEIHRVLAPGGISLHLFPGRFILIEPHVFVPLAALIKHPAWLYPWAWLGIRNPYQSGMGARDVAADNARYLAAHTHYARNREILEQARMFATAAFREDLIIAATSNPAGPTSLKRRLIESRPARAPLAWWARTFQNRLLLLTKAPSRGHGLA